MSKKENIKCSPHFGNKCPKCNYTCLNVCEGCQFYNVSCFGCPIPLNKNENERK